MSVKDHVEENKGILAKYIILSKRKEDINENLIQQKIFNTISFKTKFDQSYSIETIKYPFQEFTNELEINLENRLAIVEELKELINPQENIKDTLKHFNELRDRWKNAGSIPKDKYNHVWNNYHFHVEISMTIAS
jgi:hypothetical protein